MNRKAKNGVDKAFISKIVRKHLIMEELRNTGVQKYVRAQLNEGVTDWVGEVGKDYVKDQLDALNPFISVDGDAIEDERVMTEWMQWGVNILTVPLGIAAGIYVPGVKMKACAIATLLVMNRAIVKQLDTQSLRKIESLKKMKKISTDQIESFFVPSMQVNPIATKKADLVKDIAIDKSLKLPEKPKKEEELIVPRSLNVELTEASTPEEVQAAHKEALEEFKAANNATKNDQSSNDFLGNPITADMFDVEQKFVDNAAIAILQAIFNDGDGTDSTTLSEISEVLRDYPISEYHRIDTAVGKILEESIEVRDGYVWDDEYSADYEIIFGEEGTAGETDCKISKAKLKKMHSNPNRGQSIIYELLNKTEDEEFSDETISGAFKDLFKLTSDGSDEGLINAIGFRGDLGNSKSIGSRDYSLITNKWIESKGLVMVPDTFLNNASDSEDGQGASGGILDTIANTVKDLYDNILKLLPSGSTITDVFKGAFNFLKNNWISIAATLGFGVLTGGWGWMFAPLFGYITQEVIVPGLKSLLGKDEGGGSGGGKDDDKDPPQGRKSGTTSNTTKENVKEIEGLINAYNDDNGLTAEDITVDTRWEGGGTGNTDRVWRDPFIKHVFSEHPVFKEKTFAGEVVSGQVWLWKDLSKLMISEYPDFTSDSAGCLAFVKFVYNEDTTGGGDTKGGGGASKFVDNSSGRLKGSRNSGYNDESDLMIGVKFDAKKVRSLESIEEDVRNKIIDVNYLGDMFPKLDEKISIALIRDMKNYDLFSGKAGTSVRDQGMQFKMKLKTKGSGDNIKISARPLEGRRHFRGMSKTFEEALNDRVSEVLRNSEAKRKEVVKMFDGCEVTIELKGGRYRVMGESFISEDDKRKLIRSAIINSIRRS
jgi:hypothetical protein